MPQQVYQTDPRQSVDTFSSFVGGALAGAKSVDDFRRKKKVEGMEDWRFSKERHEAGERAPGSVPSSINGPPRIGGGSVPGTNVPFVTPFNPNQASLPTPPIAGGGEPGPIPGAHLGSMRGPQNMPGGTEGIWGKIKAIGGRVGGFLGQMDDSLDPGIDTEYSPEAPTSAQSAATTDFGRDLMLRQTDNAAALERQRLGDAAALEREQVGNTSAERIAKGRQSIDERNAASLEIQNQRLQQQNLVDQLKHYDAIVSDPNGIYSDFDRRQAQQMIEAIRLELWKLGGANAAQGVSVGSPRLAP